MQGDHKEPSVHPPPLAHIPYSVLTSWVQQTFEEKVVLVACPLADAGATQPDAVSC